MSTVNVMNALMNSVNLFFQQAPGPYLANTDVNWPNSVFDPTGKQVWAEVHYIPNTPSVLEIGKQGADDYTGLVQINLNVPQGTLWGVLQNWEEKARDYFVAGKTVSYLGAHATITGCGLDNGRHVDKWYQRTITITFRADVQRAYF